MDKYELVLRIIEHPDNYTPAQLAEILSDPDTREIYNLLCKAGSAMEDGKEVDAEAEWKTFAEKHKVGARRPLFGSAGRAASITAVIGTSIVAVAAGITMTVVLLGHKTGPETTANATETTAHAVIATDSIEARSGSAEIVAAPVLFENESLDVIMGKIAERYNVEVKFNNNAAQSLRLYYTFNPALPLGEIVEQLNTFEQIDIKRNDNTLCID